MLCKEALWFFSDRKHGLITFYKHIKYFQPFQSFIFRLTAWCVQTHFRPGYEKITGISPTCVALRSTKKIIWSKQSHVDSVHYSPASFMHSLRLMSVVLLMLILLLNALFQFTWEKHPCFKQGSSYHIVAMGLNAYNVDVASHTEKGNFWWYLFRLCHIFNVIQLVFWA